jgi:CHAD domain-containing protein
MSLIDSIVAQALRLDMALHHAHARMEARTDSEALHDLRTNTRRLRSLLHPLRKLDDLQLVNRAAGALFKLTSPVRDLEVLVDELTRRGCTQQARVREAIVQSRYADIVESAELKQLFSQLNDFPSEFRAVERSGELRHVKKKITKELRQQVNRLKAALADPLHDRHRLRLLVKRLRYATDAYPELSPISAEVASSLKRAQSALGDWHDHYQWGLKISQEPDLQPLQEDWQAASASALESSDAAWAELNALLSPRQQDTPQSPAQSGSQAARGTVR